jgi:hypothetical protein
MYYRIKSYCDVIDDFALFFSWCKKDLYHYKLYPKYYEDVFQTIALCILEGSTQRDIINRIKRELYYLTRHVFHFGKQRRRKSGKNNKVKYKNKKLTHKYYCAICKIGKYEYMYKSIIPEKTVCRNCYNKIKRGTL